MSLSNMQRIKRDTWIAAMMGISYGKLKAMQNDPRISEAIWNERQKYNNIWLKNHINELRKEYKK